MTTDNNKKPIPNLIIWSWMRTTLGLVGSELLIFSYLFCKTYDSTHFFFIPLSDMEQMFGLTRQTISRNIDKLVNKEIILKKCVKDGINPMIKHNGYTLDMSYIADLCKNSGSDNYNNFLDSLRTEFKERYNTESEMIDNYFDLLYRWNGIKDRKIQGSLEELAKFFKENDISEPIPISEFVKVVKEEHEKNKVRSNKDTILSNNDELNKEQIDKAKTKKSISNSKAPTGKLFEEPKRKSTRAKKAEWDIDKRAMTDSFVTTHLSGNGELRDLLHKFLDTANGKSYTPYQWEIQLDDMYKYGRTVPRMIQGVRKSFANNYRTLYIKDSDEVDFDLKCCEIYKFVAEYGEGSEKLKEILVNYISDVQKPKRCTANQFKMLLMELHELCPTLEQKLKSAEYCYIHSYNSLAYSNSNNFNNNSNNSINTVDLDKKIEAVHKFIQDGCYYLCEGLEESLIEYVSNTQAGSTMSYDDFCTNLSNFRLFCLDDKRKVEVLHNAIKNNYKTIIMEDYQESKTLKASGRTRDFVARCNDRARKEDVLEELEKHPNNPKLKGIPEISFY